MAKPKHKIPVKINERLELQIDSLASSGDGICHYSGYTVFVPSAVPGDRFLGEIIKITPKCLIPWDKLVAPPVKTSVWLVYFYSEGCKTRFEL